MRATFPRRLLAPGATLALLVLTVSCTLVGQGAGQLLMQGIEEAYETGDVSLSIGVAFAADDSLRPGLCADVQLRGYLGDYVTWDMSYQRLQFDDRLMGGRLSANMFVIALGAHSDVFVRELPGRPFRWGAAFVLAIPGYNHSGGLEPVGDDRLVGAKLTIDWRLPTDWRWGWAYGILEVQMLWGDTIADATRSVDWDMCHVLAVKGGLRLCW